MEYVTTEKAELCYWGNRTYVHSSSIFEDLLRILRVWELGCAREVKAYFGSVLVSNALFVMFTDKEHMTACKDELSAWFEIHTSTGTHHVGLVPTDGEIMARRPDDEAKLLGGHRVQKDEQWASVVGELDSRFVARMTALNKTLHTTVFDSAGFEPWFSVGFELNLDTLHEHPRAEIKVAIGRRIGDRSTKSDVYIDDEKIGTLYFLRRKQVC